VGITLTVTEQPSPRGEGGERSEPGEGGVLRGRALRCHPREGDEMPR
jgi:hypothetical protein